MHPPATGLPAFIRSVDLKSAQSMAISMLAHHGLTDWRVEFDNAKRRAGVCKHRTRTIGLSAALTRLHPEAEVRETVLHEVAHALAGPQHEHDAVWRSIAVAIGGTGERCVPAEAPRVVGAWLGVCAAGHQADRHRRPERLLLCAPCRGREPSQRVLEWTYRGQPARMHPNFQAELNALLAGERQMRLRVGSPVTVSVEGPWHGRAGVIEKIGRTRYHVRLGDGLLTVPFQAVEPVRR